MKMAWFIVPVALLLLPAVIAVYRLVLHPLAHVPGPKLAAITNAYELYFDVVRGGQYTFEIQRLHQIYGPIVRISPNELHVNEAAFIDELYAGPGKIRDKYDHATGQFGIPDSVFGAIHHNLHRMRRAALNPFFSKASVTKLEPVIYAAVDKLCWRLARELAQSGSTVDLTMVFSCMTTDIVTKYAFAESSRFLDSPTWQPNFHQAILSGTRMGALARHVPLLFPVLRALPVRLMSKLSPDTGVFLQWQEDMKRKVSEIWQEQSQQTDKPQTQPHATIFHELFHADLPESEKHPDRMWQEGQIVIGAGTETTAWSNSIRISIESSRS
ncbi:cytochrome P450 [Aspergillus melleus]|uniref:cytochrome P450 n=1 Tax=Aspergillus melleus TaxID=138277 RepID=UPI001E8CE8DE|nr:uncharacterized protein LDX57_009725 [Aspergillus melleus]KAH8432079.1 hypothetical protein LDX57_009725 [Aspergillus melleus]